MFNTYNDFNYNYNINAVSGTLRKSHPKSHIVVRKIDSGTCLFDDSKPTAVYQGKEAVVLQVMLVGNGNCLVEFVYKSDVQEDN